MSTKLKTTNFEMFIFFVCLFWIAGDGSKFNSQSGSSSGGLTLSSGSDFLLLAISILLFLLLCTGCLLLCIMVLKRKENNKRHAHSKSVHLDATSTNTSGGNDVIDSLRHVASMSHSSTTNKFGTNMLLSSNGFSNSKGENDDNNINNTGGGLAMEIELDMINGALEKNVEQPNVNVRSTAGLSIEDGDRNGGEGEASGFVNGHTNAPGGSGKNNGPDTGAIININGRNLEIHGNWGEWNSSDVNEWLKRELLNTKFNVDTIDRFMKEFEEIDMTGKILEMWLNESNGDSDKLLKKLQSKIEFKPRSLIWDVVIQAMMNL